MATLTSRHTSRAEDWARVLGALRNWPNSRLLHTLTNALVEELRRHGLEPKNPDHSYRWPWQWREDASKIV